MFDRVDHTNKSFLRCVLTCNLSCFSVGLAHGFGKWNWSAKQNEYNYGWNYIIMMMGLNQVQKKLIKFSLVSLLGYFCIESLTHINRISPAKDVFSYMWEHSKCFFRYNYMHYSHELLTFVCSVLESMRNMVSHSFERLFGLFFRCVRVHLTQMDVLKEKFQSGTVWRTGQEQSWQLSSSISSSVRVSFLLATARIYILVNNSPLPSCWCN